MQAKTRYIPQNDRATTQKEQYVDCLRRTRSYIPSHPDLKLAIQRFQKWLLNQANPNAPLFLQAECSVIGFEDRGNPYRFNPGHLRSHTLQIRMPIQDARSLQQQHQLLWRKGGGQESRIKYMKRLDQTGHRTMNGSMNHVIPPNKQRMMETVLISKVPADEFGPHPENVQITEPVFCQTQMVQQNLIPGDGRLDAPNISQDSSLKVESNLPSISLPSFTETSTSLSLPSTVSNASAAELAQKQVFKMDDGKQQRNEGRSLQSRGQFYEMLIGLLCQQYLDNMEVDEIAK